MIIQEGRSYRARNGDIFRNARRGTRTPGAMWLLDTDVSGTTITNGYNGDGTPYADVPTTGNELNLVEQVIGDADQPFVPDLDPRVILPGWAESVEAEAAADRNKDAYIKALRDAKPHEVIPCPADMTEAEARKIVLDVAEEKRRTIAALADKAGVLDQVVPDVKVAIADEAKRIVSGARRSAYGKPENNFQRIADLWTGYAKAKGWPVEFAAADVSPMMVLMKLARIVESPDHRDSHVDGIGYFLTMAEVNKVKADA